MVDIDQVIIFLLGFAIASFLKFDNSYIQVEYDYLCFFGVC